jgi:hypothetical protein
VHTDTIVVLILTVLAFALWLFIRRRYPVRPSVKHTPLYADADFNLPLYNVSPGE